ncbi:CYTH and CHAD domain-containing protein [Acetobacter fallax]|uniref:CHAD domain-containing protein n=1 Tax=Acetobacter fallax TaxID=1737473 RepID=A0ABX0K8K7_9PROT|nr:CYTH and CHAD domain-containing protein [Acetobacter fallax]NHO31533.1 CHAD domain-containing protein [Acetobacter fallax]NHO35092.1 CHAD domain-containing protein [Acetobacter fallax]
MMAEKTTIPPQEIELKLVFPPDARALIDRHPVFQGASVSEQHLVTTYYDTSDLILHRTGFSLRVRQHGRKRMQTLKSGSIDGGVAARRHEWEWPVRSSQPDLALLAKTPAAALEPVLAGNVKPVVVTDIRRTVLLLKHDEALVEVAIDEGVVRAAGKTLPIREIELELKDGPILPLCRLALRLQAALPLRIGVESKAERGYRMLRGEGPVAVEASIPALPRRVMTGDGFRMIIRAGLEGLIRNQPAAEAGDVEGIHQMRVAIRKLRSALQLFEPYLEAHTIGPFEDELQRLGRVLGEARDRDVFCMETLPAVFSTPDSNDWRLLLDRVATESRDAAHQAVQRELAGPALTALALGLMAWAEDRPLSADEDVALTLLAAIAPAPLDRFFRKVNRRGRRIDPASPETLHDLRKSLKKLRYGADYFASLFPGRRVRPYLKRCKILQRALGEINDAAVALTLADEFSDSHVDLAPACGAVARWSDRKTRKALRKFPQSWKDFQDVTPFWR